MSIDNEYESTLQRLAEQVGERTSDVGEVIGFLRENVGLETGPHQAPTRFADPRVTRLIADGLPICDPGSDHVDPNRRRQVLEFLAAAVEFSRKRLQCLEQNLNQQFVGKQDIIRLLLVAATSQQPILILGDPGTAKSAIVERFCDGLGIRRADAAQPGHSCFKYLLHPFTEPDEVLGVLNIRDLITKHVFKRHRAGSITESVVVILDEVFRANSALLNALLSIINERRVYEGGQIIRALSRVIVGMSNDLPVGREREDLKPFLARYVLRALSDPVPLPLGPQDGNAADRQRLLELGFQHEVREQRAGYDPLKTAAPQVACLNDILICNRAAVEFWGAEDLANGQIRRFVADYQSAVTVLAGDSQLPCPIDDRKFIKLFMAARAHAVLRSNEPPAAADLAVMCHAWDDPDHAPRLIGRVHEIIEKCQQKH